MASLLENIRNIFSPDDGLRVRMREVPGKENELGISTQKDDITNKQISAENSLIDATDVDRFVSLSKYRDEKYQAFEEMLSDAITAAALEMYADDSTQYNRDYNIIWVEADDPLIAEAGNRLLKVLDIQANAWRHIYSLCTYGDLYFRLYRDGDKSDTFDTQENSVASMTVIPYDPTRKLEERIEYVPNPATVFDLQEKDKTVGFLRTKSYINSERNVLQHNIIGSGFQSYISSIQSGDCELLNNTAYVHILLSESIDRNPEYISVDDENGESNVYKIKTGKSILEDAYPVSRTLELLEDSLVLNRLSKSAILRILEVEIGDSPKTEGENMMRRIKNLMEQKMSMNTSTGKARSYNSPGPIENIIYVPTRGEKGKINANTIGGDINIRDIVDIEYFQNRKLAALKVPKQFLNFDSAEGFSNGTSLTKVSSRYAHTVMRIQTAYIKGITTLLNIFFIDKGLDYVNKFKVKMVSPSTVEDSERDEQLNDRINQARDILDLIDSAGISETAKNEIFIDLLNNHIGINDIASIVQNDLDRRSKDTSEEETSDETNEDIGREFDDFSREIESNLPLRDVTDFSGEESPISSEPMEIDNSTEIL